jgi:hypothetical protein
VQEFFRTAMYSKNVPVIERLVRIGLAALLVSLPIIWPLTTWAAYLCWGNAAFIAATGFIGFCPACYLGGRRLVSRRT